MDVVGAVGLLWRDRARRQWRSWVAFGILLGLGTGAGLACVAGARRTASTFERIAAATGYMDAASSHGIDPAVAAEVVAGLTTVASHTSQVGFAGLVDQLGPADLTYFIGSWREPLRHGVPILRSGHVPDPNQVEEVLVQGPGPIANGVEPGDHLTFRVFTSDFQSMTTVDLVVAGIGDDPLALTADATYARNAMYLTPAFTERYGPDHQAWSSTRLSAIGARPAGSAGCRAPAGRLVEIDETRSQAHRRVQDSIRPLLVVLVILGALLFVATVAVVSQGLLRLLDADRADSDAAGALGCTPRQLLAVQVGAAAAVAVPAALLSLGLRGYRPVATVPDGRRSPPRSWSGHRRGSDRAHRRCRHGRRHPRDRRLGATPPTGP